MDYKNNVDILTWKRVIQNLQEKTDESANSYNEAQISVDDQDNIETEHYNVVVSSNDHGIIVDVYDKHDPQKEPIKSDQYWDEDVMESKETVTEESEEDFESEEDLINKVAMWIYHESDSPISEIEHLLRLSGELPNYQDAVSENKEKVTEGTWSIPDTPEKVKELKDLMKQELPADEAQDKIYGILGDDELFDDIAEMEEKDPKADVRGMIVRRLDDLGLIKKKVNETTEALTEEQFDEAAGEKDACYHKVKARYKIWPSAYASGALTQCRKKGAKNWGNSKK
jgi:hypothetical protein